jgi:hypothetical protein
MLVGCVLPWFAATGGEAGLTPVTTNAFSDKGIVVFICALAILALVTLPYAAGDKPVALDRTLSYVIVLIVAIGAFAWRMLEFILIDPAGLRPDLAPGAWLVAVGLIVLARATYEIHAETRT